LGDSNFVFGVIAGAEFTRNGDIAILDAQKSTVSLFTPDGELIRRIGRNGSDSGEFQISSGMTFMPEGGLVVSDVGWGRKTDILR